MFLCLQSNLVSLAIDCGYLPVPRNGSIIGGETKFPNLLRFECDEGFTLVGSHEKKCLANGTWSGTNTFCEGISHGKLIETHDKVNLKKRNGVNKEIRHVYLLIKEEIYHSETYRAGVIFLRLRGA